MRFSGNNCDNDNSIIGDGNDNFDGDGIHDEGNGNNPNNSDPRMPAL